MVRGYYGKPYQPNGLIKNDIGGFTSMVHQQESVGDRVNLSTES